MGKWEHQEIATSDWLVLDARAGSTFIPPLIHQLLKS